MKLQYIKLFGGGGKQTGKRKDICQLRHHLRQKGFQSRRVSNAVPAVYDLRRLLLDSGPFYTVFHCLDSFLMEEVDVEPAVTVSKLMT